MLVTDAGIIRLKSIETVESDAPVHFLIDEIDSFSTKEYPFAVYGTDRSEIFIRDYYLGDEFDEIARITEDLVDMGAATDVLVSENAVHF